MPRVVRSIVKGPSLEPIDLEAAKAHLRLDLREGGSSDGQDALITKRLVAVREHVEAQTNRALITQTWRLTLDRFPPWSHPIVLEGGKIEPSSVRVCYVDETGTEQELELEQLQIDEADQYRPRVLPLPQEDWPSTELGRINAVTVEYRVGFGDAATDVPDTIIAAMLLHLADLFEHREETVLNAVPSSTKQYERLIASHRIISV